MVFIIKISILFSLACMPLQSVANPIVKANLLESQDKVVKSGWESLQLINYEVAAVTGFVTYLGLNSWAWGSSKGFSFNEEGWFGFDTGSGGHDKLGHFYSSYIMTEFFYGSWNRKLENQYIFSYYPAIFSWFIMLYVEVFDGYSEDHGFSYEDLIANSTGIGFAMMRNRFPYLQDLIDFRLEYDLNSFRKARHPITDYMNQKYHLIFKGTGIPTLKSHNIGRYLEFGIGYYARGFKDRDTPKTKTTFISIGINLDQLLFKPLGEYIPYGRSPKYLFDYFQLPHSYLDKESTKSRQ